MGVLGPGGSIAASKTSGGMMGRPDKERTSKSGSVSAGTTALLGGQVATQTVTRGPGVSIAASKTPGGITGGAPTQGKTAASGEAPTFTRVAPPAVLPSGTTSTPNATDTTDITGRPQYQGTSPYVSNPSDGQIIGLGASMIPGLGTLNTLGGIVNDLLHGRSPTATYSGGLLGQSADEADGSTPGSTTGYVGNRVSSSTNSRGDVRATDDTRLFDRASTAARDQIAGGPTDVATGGDDGGAEFSSVKLADRRRPYDTTSAVDLLRGLL